MAIFNSYVSLPEGIYVNNVHNCSYGRHPKLKDSCPPRWVVTTILDCGPSQTQPSNQSWSKSVTCCEMVWTAWLQLWRAGMALYGPVDRVFKGFVWTPSGNMSRKSRCIQMLHPKGRKPPWLKASVAGWDELRSPETFPGSHGAFGIHRSPARVRVTLTKQLVVGESSGRKQSTDPDYPSMGTTSWRSVAGCRANLTAGGCMWPFPWVAVRGRRKSRMFKERASNITTYIVTSHILSYLSYTEDQGLTL